METRSRSNPDVALAPLCQTPNSSTGAWHKRLNNFLRRVSSAAWCQAQQPLFIRSGETAVLNPGAGSGRIFVQPKRCNPVERFVADFRIQNRDCPCRRGIWIFSQQTVSVSAERFVARRAAQAFNPFARG